MPRSMRRLSIIGVTSALCSCGPSVARFDGKLALWDWARSDPIVNAPLPADVSIPLPIIELEPGAESMRRIEETFAKSLQRTHVHYTTGKRIFRNCSSSEVAGAYRIMVRVEVSEFDGEQLTGLGKWQLLSPDGEPLLSREQPLSQRFQPGHAFEDYGAFYYFLTDVAPLVREREARSAAAKEPPRKSAADPIVIAVFDVQETAGLMTPAQLDQLTEYLTVKLTETTKFRVVPRTQIRERLREEKTNTYTACFDESCQIELGKNLAAQKSLSTKLLQVGTDCVLTSTLFDLKTETTERAASVTTGCAVNAMFGGVDEIVRRLAAN
jgi:hypothetical protein